MLGGAAALAGQAKDVRGVAYVGTEAPEGTAGNDVRTLAQEIRGRIDPARPAVVAVAARATARRPWSWRVNAAAKSRGLSAADLVKGALLRPGRRQRRPRAGRRRARRPGAGLLLAVEKAIAEA